MLTELQKLAINQLAPTVNRSQIPTGVHLVQPFTVEFQAELYVNPPETFAPTTEIPMIPVIALALRKMGIQRDNFLKAMLEASVELMGQSTAGRNAVVQEYGLAAFEHQLREKVLSQLPRKTRAGKVLLRSGTVSPVVQGIGL